MSNESSATSWSGYGDTAHANSNCRLIAVLEPVRELLRYVEDVLPDLREQALEILLSVDGEIEYLRRNG